MHLPSPSATGADPVRAPRIARPAPLIALLAIALTAAACAEGEPPSNDRDTLEPNDTTHATDDTTGSEDAEDDLPDVPVTCLPTACAIGTAVCGGTGAVIECIDDGNGCGTLGSPVACGLSDICQDGQCVPFQSCTDGDGDGFGVGCFLGDDCDDTDATINPGADEICGDGVDNNCAGGIDEGCTDPCAGQVCLPTQRRCNGAGQLEECITDANGCGNWGPPVACTGGVCTDGACQGCIDNDGDGRGENCPLGDDCDDNNPNRYAGNLEVCDGIDNDCDGQIDEDFASLGNSCTVGQGACQASGVLVCAANQQGVVCNAVAGQGTPEMCGDSIDSDCDGNNDNGFESIGQSCTAGVGACARTGTIVCDNANRRQTRCNATPAPQGSAEICDGIDNDCDNAIDEGDICTSCTDDIHEPNQSSTQTTDLTTAKTISALMSCGGDIDWFYLGMAPQIADIELVHPTGNNGVGAPWSNLNIEFYCGATFCSGLYGSDTRTTFNSAGCCDSGRVTLRVYPQSSNPASGTPYSLIRR